MSRRRPSKSTAQRWTKSRHILVGIILTGGLLLGAPQTWWHMSVTTSTPIAIHGSDAVSAIVAFGLALLALCGAVSLCGPIMARVLGVLEALFVLAAGTVMVLAVQDPIGAARPTLASSTGLSGLATLHRQVTAIAMTPWIPVTFGVLALLLVHSVLGILAASTWTAPRRYRTESPGLVEVSDPASVWDALSSDTDPTTGAPPTGGSASRDGN